jgi:chromate transporter
MDADGWPTSVGGIGGVLLGALCGVVALNLPGLAVVVACLPFWEDVRHRPAVRSTLRGINAGVVGLLGAALLLAAVAVFEVSLARGAGWIMFDAMLVAVGFTLLRTKRAPPWAVVLGTGSLVATVLTLA